MGNLLYLRSAIDAVAPVEGVSVADWNDKSTWRIDFQPAATPAQRTAAQSVIDGYDPSTPPAAAEVDFGKQMRIDALDLVQLQIAFNHENRIRALENKQPISVAQFKGAIKALL